MSNTKYQYLSVNAAQFSASWRFNGFIANLGWHFVIYISRFRYWRITVSVLWVHCWIVAIRATVIDDPDRSSAGRLLQTPLQSSSGDWEVLSLWQMRACFTPHEATFHCAHKFSLFQQLVSKLIAGVQKKKVLLGFVFGVIFPKKGEWEGKKQCWPHDPSHVYLTQDPNLS